jgi:hypothetical protein
MRIQRAGLIVALVVAGCATKMPQTADEFRRMAPGVFMIQVQSFEVQRPLREVGETFRRRAPECLNVTTRSTEQGPGHYHVVEAAYKPTTLVGAERAELHIQQKHVKGVLAVHKEPEAGHYLFVVDASAVDRGTTKVQIIGPAKGYDVVVSAVKAWASGSSMACPDLTKIG